MIRNIFFDAKGLIHSSFKEFIDYPPEGYQFIIDSAYFPPSRPSSDYPSMYKVARRYLLGTPETALLASNLRFLVGDKLITKKAQADLTFSPYHLVFRKERWVAFVEHLGGILPVPYDISNVRMYRRFVEKVLASDHCRKILLWCNAAERTLLQNLDCSAFAHKMEIINLAVGSKPHFRKSENELVTLLFIGSVNIQNGPAGFEGKGGKETLEAFARLNEIYGSKLELLLRCRIPKEVRAKYRKVLSLSNVKVLEELLPVQGLERLFRQSDIFIHPGHQTPSMTFLDAMSYGLPIITTDVFANLEIVKEGINGLVIKERLPIDNYHCNWDAIKETNQQMITELVEKTKILIDDPAKRREMGEEGRKMVENGKFSITERNRKLAKVFGECIE